MYCSKWDDALSRKQFSTICPRSTFIYLINMHSGPCEGDNVSNPGLRGRFSTSDMSRRMRSRKSLEAYNGNSEIRKDMKAVRARYSQDRYSEIDEGMVWGDNRKDFCLLKTLASNQRQQGSPAFGRQSSPRSMVALHLLMDPNILQETEVRPRQPAGTKGWRRAGIFIV